jgi:hypothetical protein
MAKAPLVSHKEAIRVLDVNKKCCGECAFRAGSPEREDQWAWLKIAEGAEDDQTFFCHESIPGHYGEVVDHRSRFRVCAGRAATEGKSIIHLCFDAVRRDRVKYDEQMAVHEYQTKE